MNRLALSGVTIGVALLTGCAPFPLQRGTTFAPGQVTASAMPETAWVAKVTVDGLPPAFAEATEDSLTLHFAEYLRSRRLFANVRILPGNPGANDRILRLHFTSFDHECHVHPAYFPFAMASLTLYIWLGGPMYGTSTHYAAHLKVENSGGVRIAEATRDEVSKASISIYADAKFDFGPARSAVVAHLLNDVFPRTPPAP